MKKHLMPVARRAVLDSMKRLNRDACEILKEFEVHACTDVTGFGLGGHATEMAVASERTIVIDTEKLPVLPDVEKFASMGLIPGGAYRNREFAEKTGVKSQAVLWVWTVPISSPPICVLLPISVSTICNIWATH